MKSSKIVAGLEAEKTNELFQAIAFALDNNLDGKEAVSVVKHGHQNGNEPKVKQKTSKTAVKPVKATAPSRDRTPAKPEPKKAITSQRSIEKKTSLKEKEKPKEKERSTSKSRVATDQKKLRKSPSKEKEGASKLNGDIITNGSLESQSSIHSLPRQASLEKKEEPVTVIETQPEQKPLIEDEANKENEIKLNGDAHHEPEPEKEIQPDAPPVKPQDELAAIIDEEAEYRRKEKISRKLSVKHRQKSVEDVQPQDTADATPKSNQTEKVDRFQSSYKRESVDRPRTSLRPPSARPASSRPAAPRRRDKNVEIVLQPEETMKIGDISVKMESFTKELEDDGENLVIIEDSTVVSDSFMNERLTKVNSEDINEDEQGKLVQQILETEKNFEGALGMEAKRTEIVSRNMTCNLSETRNNNNCPQEFDESKTQTNVKQIEHLKDLIQKLVRSVNPMGKLMDFVQEDIDSMQREYTKWNEIYKQATVDLKKEQM